MSTGGGPGYTIYIDEPKINGAGSDKEENGSTDGTQKGQDGLGTGHGHSLNDPDWSILDDRRGDLPGFLIDTLSAACQGWVERAAHGAGATPAHVAVPLLGIASSLIGTARRVMASRSWTQPMTTWTAVVGFSGTSKTPGIDATKRALSQIERDRKSKITELKRAHEGRVEAAKAERAQWKKEVARVTQEKSCRCNNIVTKSIRSQ
jgi:hypothetical protein